MQIISYVIYYGFVKPLSMLPMFILYGISDVLYIILWFVIPYRKKVVLQNLQRSFPEKSNAECLKIAKQFYRHFTDVMVETLKGFSASKQWLNTKVIGHNTDLLEKYFLQNKSIIAITGHYGNWEWGALTFSEHTKHKPYGIYAPLNNRFWNNVLINSRKKFGTTLIAVKEVGQVFTANLNEL
ncbi:MAG TPA: lipid A biosynthesis acyltransferase, partial [Bacteroidia bacterium]|nr:lipid A biosynthesis acyltransferase [Bacteroidia bacterium]